MPWVEDEVSEDYHPFEGLTGLLQSGVGRERGKRGRYVARTQRCEPPTLVGQWCYLLRFTSEDLHVDPSNC